MRARREATWTRRILGGSRCGCGRCSWPSPPGLPPRLGLRLHDLPHADPRHRGPHGPRELPVGRVLPLHGPVGPPPGHVVHRHRRAPQGLHREGPPRPRLPPGPHRQRERASGRPGLRARFAHDPLRVDARLRTEVLRGRAPGVRDRLQRAGHRRPRARSAPGPLPLAPEDAGGGPRVQAAHGEERDHRRLRRDRPRAHHAAGHRVGRPDPGPPVVERRPRKDPAHAVRVLSGLLRERLSIRFRQRGDRRRHR